MSEAAHGDDGRKYAYAFDPDEPNNTAASVYALARAGGGRVLDIGAGPGIVARALAGADGKHVTALDSSAAALAEAAAAGVQETHVVDLEQEDWAVPLRGAEPWDTVVLADVLEHLREPGRLVASLLVDGLLREDGRLVVSIPNASHQAVLAELLAGDFRYTETGLLDATHIRWFTLESMTRLLEGAGFVVTEVRRTLRTLEQTTHGYRRPQLSEAALRAVAETGLEGRTYQYVLLARPSGGTARLATLGEGLERAQRENQALRSEVVVLQRRLQEQERSAAGELAAARADVAAAEQRLQEQQGAAATAQQALQERLDAVQELLREERGSAIADLRAGVEEVQALRRKVQEQQRKLNALRASRTYRAGRVVATARHPRAFASEVRKRLGGGSR